MLTAGGGRMVVWGCAAGDGEGIHAVKSSLNSCARRQCGGHFETSCRALRAMQGAQSL